VYLESKYNTLKSTSPSGRFDLELFKRLVSPPLPRQLTGSKCGDAIQFVYTRVYAHKLRDISLDSRC